MSENREIKSLKNGFDKLSADEKAQAIIEDAFWEKFSRLDRTRFTEDDNKILSSCIQKFNKIMGERLDENKKGELEKLLYKEISIYKKYSGLKLYEIYNAIGYYSELGLNEVDYVKKYIVRPYYGRNKINVSMPYRLPYEFRRCVQHLDEYLGDNGCICKEKILEAFVDRKENKKLLETVFYESFNQKYECKIPRIHRMGIDTDSFDSIVKSIKECDGCTLGENCNVRSHLMFWMLFVAGIDEENYTENLRMISDMAVIFNFDEDHLKDWSMAAKNILEKVKVNNSKKLLDSDHVMSKKTYMNCSVQKKFATCTQPSEIQQLQKLKAINYKMHTNLNTTEAKKLKTINYKTSEAREFFIRKQEGDTAVL